MGGESWALSPTKQATMDLKLESPKSRREQVEKQHPCQATTAEPEPTSAALDLAKHHAGKSKNQPTE